MEQSVPFLSIVFMIISGILAVAMPVGLLLWYRYKRHADIAPFVVGCIVMLVFALLLESLVHNVVLTSPVGRTIQDSVILYALYGGFMAALFEEGGRFIAFKTVLRKKQSKDANALMYGAGHGGLEAFAILGIAMVNNIAWSLLINSGNTALLTSSVTGEQRIQVEMTIQALITTPSVQFLFGGIERVFAIILQIALSVFVWFAAKKKGKGVFFLYAFLIHFAVDAITVILSGVGVSTALLEVVVGIMALATAFLSKTVYTKEKSIS